MDRPASHNSALNRLIDQLNKLPGIGRRSAERVAFHLLKQPESEALALAQAIHDFRANLRVCARCHNVAETDPCPLCSDPRRDATVLLVVEQPSDVVNFEATGQYRGLYHVLMGRLAPLDGVGPGELTAAALLKRVRSEGVKEVILGTQPTLEGDGTALYLADELQKAGVTVTRLARGLPVGASLDAVSKAVLGDAIHGRRQMS